MTEYCTDPCEGNPARENPKEKSVDKGTKERYHSPQSDLRPFTYEPVCVGCRTNSEFVFASGCEGCRERMRLLGKNR